MGHTKSVLSGYARLYLVLMEAETKLSPSTMNELEEVLAAADDLDVESLVHHLWLLNARSRYEWFVLRNFDAATQTIEQMATRFQPIMFYKFEKFDAETKMFPLFLALNTARLSAYRGELDQHKSQLDSFEAYLQHGTTTELICFPRSVATALSQFEETLRPMMNASVKEYFQKKITKSRNGVA